MLLNSFFKRLLRNEGVQEDKDDIFRSVYMEQRYKTSQSLRRRPEVLVALRAIFDDHINKIRIDKLGSIFSFLVKSQFPVSQEDIKNLSKAFKRNLVINTSNMSLKTPATNS